MLILKQSKINIIIFVETIKGKKYIYLAALSPFQNNIQFIHAVYR